MARIPPIFEFINDYEFKLLGRRVVLDGFTGRFMVYKKDGCTVQAQDVPSCDLVKIIIEEAIKRDEKQANIKKKLGQLRGVFDEIIETANPPEKI